MRDGLIKIAAATPALRVADCTYNAQQTIALMAEAEAQGVKVLCFPELGLTGSTCGDLFLQPTLLEGAKRALEQVVAASAGLEMLVAVGLPLRSTHRSHLYNCAAVFCDGALLGVVPKRFLSQNEGRWFVPGEGYTGTVELCEESIDLNPDQIFCCEEVPNLRVGVELGEDLWVTAPPSAQLCAAGATVMLHPSASHEQVCRADYRRSLVTGQSGRLVCAYVHAGAGIGESTTDLVFAGHDLLSENGVLLAERRFQNGLLVSETDVDLLAFERCRMPGFPNDCEVGVDEVTFSLTPERTALTRPIGESPFVPADPDLRRARCEEIFTLASMGLRKRLEHTRAACAVIGLSGGLDSTLALLITARAMELLGRPNTDILALTMPCFGTTDRTRDNATKLAECLGTRFQRVDIGEAVQVHFRDIGLDPADRSVAYENAQARERTQVLMDIANRHNGLVVGTGDLSEMALGWCTYNGDHMSMYAVNASIPKTLVRHLTAWVSAENRAENPALSAVLDDILDTPVSPELLPPEDGQIAQKTEDLVGPYELHDFFLFYALRYGFPPRKILRFARAAFGDRYSKKTLLHWMENFYRRFFNQQFKRSCVPDGPKVGSVSLSPRGDWQMPSDAVSVLWMEEVKKLGRN